MYPIVDTAVDYNRTVLWYYSLPVPILVDPGLIHVDRWSLYFPHIVYPYHLFDMSSS